MTTIITSILIMIATGLVAGCFGSLMGVGGAMITTPILVLALGVDIKYAIAAGLIVVISTSSGSAIAFLKDKILNLRAAMFLEIFTSIGGIIGAFVAAVLASQILQIVHGTVLLFSGCNMVYRTYIKKIESKCTRDDKLALSLKLNSSYYDKQAGEQVEYKCEKIPLASGIMLFAGIISGSLGVGSGPFKVIAMDNAMKMPIKVSTSTSNLMMGVTACASAIIYFFNGMILPQIAAPLAIGVVVGSMIGSRIMPLLPAKTLKAIFIPLVFLLAFSMFAKAAGLWV